MTATPSTGTTGSIEDLFSDRALMARPGMVGTNPRAIADVIAFSGGYPDPSTLPIQDIIESTRIALERDGEWALQYAFGSGVPELVKELSAKLARDQKIIAGPENILITSGSSQALALIFELLVNPGDVVIAEAPWFMGTIWRAKASGADVREIPMDDQGMVIEELERVLNELRAEDRRAKLLYMVPTFQNPSGITYSLERRKAIVALAQEHGLPILEDDAYFDLRFEGDPIPPLYTLDDQGLVMYCGTFSKIMAAGMRLGWCVAAPNVIARLSGLKADSGTNPFASHIAAQFCSSGTLQEHNAQLRPLYQHRRDVMLDALKEQMPDGTTWTVPAGGFFIWLTLPEGVECGPLAAKTQERGVGIGQGTMFFANGQGSNNVRLSYSFNDDDEIRRGIRILGEAIREQMP
jgi:2-aminoadipate transaminase